VGRLRLVLIGALLGLTWAASLRSYMMVLAGLDSTFTFSGTFGILLPSGAATGAALGWAEYQRRAGRRHPLFIAAPLLLAVIPNVVAGPDITPLTLAVAAMIAGLAMSGRGPTWTRIVAGVITLGAVLAPYLASKPVPDLSATTAKGAWAATLLVSLYLTLALACAIPMRRPEPRREGAERMDAAGPATRRAGISGRDGRPG
jgi:hypothetical protein